MQQVVSLLVLQLTLPFSVVFSANVFGASISCQTVAYLQWINAVSAGAPANRPPLSINMDEIALVRHTSGLVGTVLTRKRGAAKGTLGDAMCSCVFYRFSSATSTSFPLPAAMMEALTTVSLPDSRHHACLDEKIFVFFNFIPEAWFGAAMSYWF